MKVFDLKSMAVAATLAAAALTATSNTANAAFTLGSCDVSDVTAQTDAGPPAVFVNATSCLNYTGNTANYQEGAGPKGYVNYIEGDFGFSNWALAGSTDGSGSATVTASADQEGTWTVSPVVDSPFIVTLKASTYFASYLFTGLTGIGGGEYDVTGVTIKVGGGEPADLSHLDVYTAVSAVPLPAAAWLMFAGIGGLGLMARRRKAKSA